MCGRHGFVLGFEGQDPIDHKNALQAFAMDCADFGEPLPDKPVALRPRVSTVSEDVIMAGPTGLSVASCHGCKNLVKHTAVYSEWKWPLPLCKAKGTLLFDPVRECKGCEWATPGMPSENLYDVELRKEFQHGFVVNVEKAFKALVQNGNLNVEPTLYETDSPVEPDDVGVIRAWRKVECPFGTGKVIHLPIFERDYWTPAQQASIPFSGNADHPELYVDYGNLLWRYAVSTWMRGRTLLIQGLPGLGKSQFVNWLGWLCQAPVTRLFHTDSIEWDDIFGKMLFLDGETKWQDGRFTEAWRHGGFILVDEPNLAKSEITATYRTTTEPHGVLYLDAGISVENGERVTLAIEKHPYAMPVWCANPAWDPRNVGTKELAAADISRLAPAVLDTPPPAVERHIISTTVKSIEDFEIPDDLLDDLMKVSADLRELSKQGEFPGTWGIRENIDVAGNLAWYPFIEAFRMTALNYYEPETANMVIEQSIKLVRPDDF